MHTVRRMRRARPLCARSPRRTLRLPDRGDLAVVATGEVRAVVGLTHLLGGAGVVRGLTYPVGIRPARLRAYRAAADPGRTGAAERGRAARTGGRRQHRKPGERDHPK